MTRFVVLGPTLTAVPRPPDARQKFMPSWAYWNGEGKFALAQGEVDITENLTAYAQVGAVKGTTQYLYSDITVTNLNGNFTGSPRLQPPVSRSGGRAGGLACPGGHRADPSRDQFQRDRLARRGRDHEHDGYRLRVQSLQPRPEPGAALSVGAAAENF